jgi:hypothetical protein
MASNSQVGKAKQAEQDDCPLLSLPAEIRNMIWEYAFGVDHIQAIQYDRPVAGKASNQYDTPSSSYTMSFEVRDRNNWRSKPQHLARLIALTSTCRQIRAECNDLPFSGNLFDVGFHAIQHFLAMVPQKILDGIKVISLWKVPGQMMTSLARSAASLERATRLEKDHPSCTRRRRWASDRAAMGRQAQIVRGVGFSADRDDERRGRDGLSSVEKVQASRICDRAR